MRYKHAGVSKNANSCTIYIRGPLVCNKNTNNISLFLLSLLFLQSSMLTYSSGHFVSSAHTTSASTPHYFVTSVFSFALVGSTHTGAAGLEGILTHNTDPTFLFPLNSLFSSSFFSTSRLHCFICLPVLSLAITLKPLCSTSSAPRSLISSHFFSLFPPLASSYPLLSESSVSFFRCYSSSSVSGSMSPTPTLLHSVLSVHVVSRYMQSCKCATSSATFCQPFFSVALICSLHFHFALTFRHLLTPLGKAAYSV